MLLGITVVVAVPAGATTGFERVDQAGTYAKLNLPNYDGVARLRDVVGRTPGPTVIGLGTFNRLDGELVILHGQPYRVGVDGVPAMVSLNRSASFVQAIPFRADASVRLPRGTACSDLIVTVDELARSTGGVVAVRLTGTFSDLVTSSVPRQSPPYKSLTTVMATQVEFPLGAVTADLVGFRTGADFTGVGPLGLHLHGLTRDRTAGGHVLSCVTERVRLTVDVTDGVHLLDR